MQSLFGRPRIAALFLLISATLSADTVVMKNGDRITGDIVKQDGKTLTIKSDNFGLINAPWDQVETIQASTPVTVTLKDGTAAQGAISVRAGQIQVGGKTAPAADVSTVRNAAEQKAYERMLKPGWGQLWAGAATLGFAGTAGNAKTRTFTLGLNANRTTNIDKTTLYFNTIRASAQVNRVTADTAQAVRGGWGYARNVRPKLFANVFNDWEYDRFQSLDLRFVLGGGAGYNAVKSERQKLDFLGGLAYNRESFSNNLQRSSLDAYWGDDYSMKVNSATSLVQGFRMFNSLNDTGRYRVNFDIGAVTKIKGWLTWNVSLSDRYLSRPAPGRKTNDFLYTTGIGISFAK